MTGELHPTTKSLRGGRRHFVRAFTKNVDDTDSNDLGVGEKHTTAMLLLHLGVTNL